MLEALERGEFERLPGEFFTRAFLRTYARELRLSPDEVVAAYNARHAAPVAVAEPAAPQTIGDERRSDTPRLLPSPKSLWPTLVLAAAIVVVISIMPRSAPDSPDVNVPVGTTGAAQVTEPAPPSQPVATEKLTIEIAPTRTMWVAGMADGKRVIYRLVEPGERVRLEAQDRFWFRVGDAGAFVFSLNGAPAKPLGKPGEVREVTLVR